MRQLIIRMSEDYNFNRFEIKQAWKVEVQILANFLTGSIIIDA